mgnify:CR=1 FL=1
MNKVKKIHSVDFKVKASGHGCVNYNGSFKYWSDSAGKVVENVKTPKMIGITNHKTTDPNENQKYITAESIPSNENAKVYISTNCLRHFLFKEGFPNHVSGLTRDHCFDFLTNPNGLVRGFAITDGNPLQRKSALLLEKAIDIKRNLVCETRTTSGCKDSTSLHTVIDTGATEYQFFGSINIEDLQFISTDNIFGRACILTTRDQLLVLTEKITKTLELIAGEYGLNGNPKAEYGFWKRKHRVITQGEWGILLNQDAIHTLVTWTLDKILNLHIAQSKNYMNVDSILTDYNSGRQFRIKRDEKSIVSEKNTDYEIYYEMVESTHQQPFEEEKKQLKSKSSKK